MAITNADELSKAIRRSEVIIEIEGQLAHSVKKIKSVGKIAWTIAASGISLAFLYFWRRRNLRIGLISVAAVAACATALLGPRATVDAVKLTIAGGGVEILNSLRDYQITESSEERIVLSRV